MSILKFSYMEKTYYADNWYDLEMVRHMVLSGHADKVKPIHTDAEHWNKVQEKEDREAEERRVRMYDDALAEVKAENEKIEKINTDAEKQAKEAEEGSPSAHAMSENDTGVSKLVQDIRDGDAPSTMMRKYTRQDFTYTLTQMGIEFTPQDNKQALYQKVKANIT